MRPAAAVWFERVALAGVTLDVLHLSLLFERRIAVDGVPLAVAFTVLIPLLTAALVLFVTRRGSRTARWLFAGLVALAVVAAFNIGTEAWSRDVAVAVGVAALALQLGSLNLLFAPSVTRWMRICREGSRPA
ncbi:hypothetical protein [Glacieibacterium frigidum]|uniref:Uncharacterized protein n=1 Tax=Glacieibacterium frigidum TaxID=2593303 RepID=A0A552UFP1_9SPHN|nr:hypothetical protein [Glacieibacterium frigidum]TRW17046.1 hypothetical protein FMM06_02225 [Glacieibacterium frigidum]